MLRELRGIIHSLFRLFNVAIGSRQKVLSNLTSGNPKAAKTQKNRLRPRLRSGLRWRCLRYSPDSLLGWAGAKPKIPP